MKIHGSVIGVLMLLFGVSNTAAQHATTQSAQDEVLVTDTIHFTQPVSVTICCGPGVSTSASASSEPGLKQPVTSINLSSPSNCGDPRDAELFLLARRLLSERGEIELDVRLQTFTVTDRRAAIESIRQLVESYTLRSSSIELADSDNAKLIAAIRSVLDAQVAAWNRGDLEGYMDGYQRSPDIVFISGDRVNRGWQTVLERYKKSYDTRVKMGVLTFSDVEITILSKDAALAFGRWQLRAKDDPRGRFTLLFKKTKNGWRIVHDHTSSA